MSHHPKTHTNAYQFCLSVFTIKWWIWSIINNHKDLQLLENRYGKLRHRVKYGLEHWTLGLFFGPLFWTFFFGPLFGSFYWGGGRPSEVREGWEADCYYLGRGGRWAISMQGGVWGGCISKCYWLMDFLLDHILPYAINYLCQALIFNLLIKTYFDWLYK